MVEKKYAILRSIATIYKILGIIVLAGAIVLGVLSLLGVVDAASSVATSGLSLGEGLGVGLVAFISLLLGGGWTALSLYALGSAIQMFVDMEHNTRETNALLRALGRRLTTERSAPESLTIQD